LEAPDERGAQLQPIYLPTIRHGIGRGALGSKRRSRPFALAIVLQRIGQPHHDDRQAGDVDGARLPPEHARDDNGDGNSQYGPNEKEDERVHDDDPPDASMRSMVWQPNCRQPPSIQLCTGFQYPIAHPPEPHRRSRSFSAAAHPSVRRPWHHTPGFIFLIFSLDLDTSLW